VNALSVVSGLALVQNGLFCLFSGFNELLVVLFYLSGPSTGTLASARLPAIYFTQLPHAALFSFWKIFRGVASSQSLRYRPLLFLFYSLSINWVS